MSDNPNNCENCKHWKTQRWIEQNTPPETQGEKLHCYHFKEPFPEVCMQHTGRNVNFFTGAPNFPIATSINDMVQSLVNAGFTLET